MAEERSGFLGRWARRKTEALQGKALDEPVVAAKPAPAPVAGAASSLGAVIDAGAFRTPGTRASAPTALPPGPAAPASTLGLASASTAPSAVAPAPQADAAAPPPEKVLSLDDVKALTRSSDFKPFMAKGVGPQVRNAAMKKLFADPHYNVMDGLDIYIDDYSIADPLPQAMLRQMASAKFLNLFDDEEDDKTRENATAQGNAATQTDAMPAAADDSVKNPDAQSLSQPDVQNLNQPDAQSLIQPDTETTAQCAEPSPSARADSFTSLSADHASQPEPAAGPGASQDHHAHSHLRLQPDHATPAPNAGRGTS